MKENIKVVGRELVVKGEAMFNDLKEAKGFEGSEKDKKFGIKIKISADNAEEVQAALNALEDEVYAEGTANFSKVKKLSTQKAPPKYKFVADAAGEPTGEITLNLQRKEALGPITIFKAGTEGAVERSFIRSGSLVLVRVTVRPYTSADKVGTSYTAHSITILEEVEGRKVQPPKLSPELDKLMGAVDINDLPF